MAITQTKTVQRIEVYPGQGENSQPTLMVVEEHFFDDPDDSELPVTSTKVYHLSERDDVSGKPQLVQDTYNALITYTPLEESTVEEVPETDPLVEEQAEAEEPPAE